VDFDFPFCDLDQSVLSKFDITMWMPHRKRVVNKLRTIEFLLYTPVLRFHW
jgi:hypothetical protein